MIARTAIAMLLATAPPASAHCHYRSHALGYSRCENTGWWAQPISWSLEAGASALHVDARAIRATAPAGTGADAHQLDWTTPPGARALAALGGGLFVRAGADRWYIGLGFDELAIARGPALVTTASDGGAASANAGAITQLVGTIGVHDTFGRLALGAELVLGARMASFSRDGGAEVQDPWQVTGLVEPRATVDAWLSPNWTVGVRAGADLLHGGDYIATLAVALHALPFDGLR